MKLPNLPYLAIAKKTASFVVGAGTSQIVKGIIKNNTSPEKTVDMVAIAGASVVIGAMAADATRSYTDAKFDAAVSWWKENVSKKIEEDQNPELATEESE